MKNDNLYAITPQVGKILIASPFLDSTSFARSVILLITYENGFMGIVINKLSDSPKIVNTLIDSLKEAPAIPLYNGGIVDKDVLFCMHTNPNIKDSLCIRKGLYINGDFSQIEKMALNSDKQDSKAKFCIGYAGWTEGQLEQEIEDGSWVVSDADSDLLFSENINQIWGTALRRMGEPYSIWTQFPLEPLLN